MKENSYLPLMFVGIIGAIILSCCNQNFKTNTISKTVSIDSTFIKTLLQDSCIYEKHFLVDINRDTLPELIVVCKSTVKSQCLSQMHDFECFYSVLNVYNKVLNDWTLMFTHKLHDFENTLISIDSTSNLIVTRKSNPSGYSTQVLTESYQYLNDNFYLENIVLLIDTKRYNGIGTDHDTWKYLINLKTSKAAVNYYTVRTLNEKGEPELITTDTTFHITLLKDFKIKLAEEYELDTLIGSDNMIHFY